MPDAFAHQHFGDLVFEELPKDVQAQISAHRDLYEIGLQGPDFFFFYKPLKKNPVSQYGSDLHKMTGITFFHDALTLCSDQFSPEQTVYLCGVLGHFTLDSICHAFVNRYEAEQGVTHSDMEGEFERYLIGSLGRDPLKEDTTARFIPSEEAAAVIAPLYPGVTAKECRDALYSYRRYRRLFFAPNSVKRNSLYMLMKTAGVYNSYRGQIVNAVPYENTEESDRELYRLLHSAVPICVRLITALAEGKEDALLSDPAMTANFDGD